MAVNLNLYRLSQTKSFGSVQIIVGLDISQSPVGSVGTFNAREYLCYRLKFQVDIHQ